MTQTDPTSTPPGKQRPTGFWAEETDATAPFFNGKGIKSQLRYVAWVDMMGANNAMRLSLPRAANFIAKIHVAGLETQSRLRLDLHPVIDGFYAVALDQAAMLNFLRLLMMKLAVLFTTEGDHSHQFFVRCGLAFGPVILGGDLAAGSECLAGASAYSATVAIGPAISQAFEAEKSAPIFGIYVHESARAFSGDGEVPLGNTLFRWWDPKSPSHQAGVETLREKILERLDWLEKNKATNLFSATGRLEEYRSLVAEYFS